MTIRQLVYRRLYLVTPGWQITRLLRLDCKCARCGRRGVLHLHHEAYPFFAMWYALFWSALFIWLFDISGFYGLIVLLVLPDMISPMRTLCPACHRIVEGRKNA